MPSLPDHFPHPASSALTSSSSSHIHAVQNSREHIIRLLSPSSESGAALTLRIDNVHVHLGFHQHHHESTKDIAGVILLVRDANGGGDQDGDGQDPEVGMYFVWCPYSVLKIVNPAMTGDERSGMAAVPVEQQVVEEQDPQMDLEWSYAIAVKLNEMESITRSIPMMGWPHMVVTVQKGVSHPPFYFHDGGMQSLFEKLSQFVMLHRPTNSDNMYIVRPLRQLPLEKSLKDQHFDQYFCDIYNNRVSMEQRDLSWQLLEWGSLVSKNARKFTQSLLSHQRPSTVVEGDSHIDEDGFEVIDVVQQQRRQAKAKETCKIEEKEELPDEPPIDMAQWSLYFNKEGQIMDAKKTTRDIFYRGIKDNETRRQAWPFLLGYYTWDSTGKQREELDREKRAMYETIKLQWTTVSRMQELNNDALQERKSRVEKDVLRTDRLVREYAAGEDINDNQNLRKLFDILVTHSVYNHNLAFCQGMGDMISPILQIMQGDEAKSFWMFASLMNSRSTQMDRQSFSHMPLEEVQAKVDAMPFQRHTMEGNFMTDSKAMELQLQQLSYLVKIMDPALYSYLEANDSLNFFFCFRWVLILFKREFDFEQIKNLWERFWSQHLGINFHLFVAYSILETKRCTIITENFPFDEILKMCIELSGNLDWKDVFQRSIKNYRQYERILREYPPTLQSEHVLL